MNAAIDRERLRRLRGRNLALALALGGFAILFFVITLVKLGGNVFGPQ